MWLPRAAGGVALLRTRGTRSSTRRASFNNGLISPQQLAPASPPLWSQALGVAFTIAVCITGLIKWLVWYFNVEGDEHPVPKVNTRARKGAGAREGTQGAKED